jgi:hypothetical protein
VSQVDRAKKKAEAKTSGGWSRPNMRKAIRNGRKKAKAVAHHAARRVGKAEVNEEKDDGSRPEGDQ